MDAELVKNTQFLIFFFSSCCQPHFKKKPSVWTKLSFSKSIREDFHYVPIYRLQFEPRKLPCKGSMLPIHQCCLKFGR